MQVFCVLQCSRSRAVFTGGVDIGCLLLALIVCLSDSCSWGYPLSGPLSYIQMPSKVLCLSDSCSWGWPLPGPLSYIQMPSKVPCLSDSCSWGCPVSGPLSYIQMPSKVPDHQYCHSLLRPTFFLLLRLWLSDPWPVLLSSMYCKHRLRPVIGSWALFLSWWCMNLWPLH